jgi:hypothetical protein
MTTKEKKQRKLLSVIVVMDAVSTKGAPEGAEVLSAMKILNRVKCGDFFVGFNPFTPTLEMNPLPFVVARMGRRCCDIKSNHSTLHLAVKNARRLMRFHARFPNAI